MLRIVICLLAGLFLSGCGKTAKYTGATDNPSSPGQQSAGVNKGKPADSDKSNKNKKDEDLTKWLDDPRYKKDNDRNSDSDGLPGKPGMGFNINQANSNWTQASKPQGTNPAAPTSTPASAGPGTPASSSSTQAKPVAEGDMKDVWVFIENRSGATGKMPSKVDIQNALAAARSPAANLVKDGSIVLTGSTTRDSVWAYEKNALTQGGWVASQNGVEKLTATQLASRLGQ